MPHPPLGSHLRSLEGRAPSLDDLEAWARGFVPFGREICVRVAVVCADLVLPYWRETFPEVLLPHQQLDAVKAWLLDPRPEARRRVAELLDSTDAAADSIAWDDRTKDAEGAAANACVWAASLVAEDDLTSVYVAVRAAVHALQARGEADPVGTVYGTIVDALESLPEASGGDAPADGTQGVILPCVYCAHVHPGLGVDCPRCHGSGPRLRSARMMDAPSAREALLRSLSRLEASPVARAQGTDPAPVDAAAAPSADADAYRERLLGLLEEAVIYGFDLVEAIAEEIRRVE